jgi:hypothetical protein
MKPYKPNLRGQDDAKGAQVEVFRCPCGGVLFDTTSRLAESLGVKHVKCDICAATYAQKIS